MSEVLLYTHLHRLLTRLQAESPLKAGRGRDLKADRGCDPGGAGRGACPPTPRHAACHGSYGRHVIIKCVSFIARVSSCSMRCERLLTPVLCVLVSKWPL